MKTRFLFPHWCRILGYTCIVAHIPVMLIFKILDVNVHQQVNDHNLFNAHHLYFIGTLLLMLVGLLLVAFSKEKIEDEQITQLRLDSLQWSIYLNYVTLIISLIFTNGIDTIDILRLNLWVPLVFFIVRFRWVLYRSNRSLNQEAV